MDGILIVDKPQGMTSHDVVAFLRKRFALKKAGHAGTLDPMATGVLVLLLGRYTKYSALFSADDKEYDATMILGARSDTADAMGRIERSAVRPDIDEKDIRDVFGRFEGEQQQKPPMYSAVKINGRKLYELARKGLEVERSPRRIFIKELKILNIAIPNISFRLICSKGTYVRQLCVDIGETLGCGAYLSRLERTRSGKFGIDQSVSMDELRKLQAEDLQNRLLQI